MCVCVFALANMYGQNKCTKCTSTLYDLHLCVFVRAVVRLTGLVDVAQQLSDFDEAGHRALRLLLQPLVVLPEALHLGLQHRLVLFLLKDIGTQQNKSRLSDRCGRNGRGATGWAGWL